VQKIKLSLKPREEYKRTEGRTIKIAKTIKFLLSGMYGLRNTYIKKIYNLLIKPIDENVAIDGIGISE
jgi:hypothetical protein